MKCAIPEIAWHNREPVLSVSFQRGSNHKYQRLASGGTDTHVLIWQVKADDTGEVSLEIVADLARHQKGVNVVRWSHNGEMLASGDDESIIIVWKQKTEVDPPPLLEQTNEQDREIWLQYKLLRGHLEDIYDISWCPLGNFLISGSVDNTAIIWDVHKGSKVGILSDHKGFVQGVSWDPKNQCVATMSSDRVFRVFDVSSKKVLGRNSKTTLPVSEDHPLHGQIFKLYYDDTLQSYFRRLDYSPDGDLIAVPTGLIENEQNGTVKHVNVAYIYKRTQIKNPICMLQCGDSPSLVVSWNPIRFKLRADGPKPLISFPTEMRLVLAVATRTSVLFYDTQQTTPIAVISNIHYTRLTDLTWSPDGLTLVVSSTDGYCSIIKFSTGELGEPLPVQSSDVEMDTVDKENVDVNRVSNVRESTAKPNKPNEKSLARTPKSKTSTPTRKKSAGTPTSKNAEPETKTVIVIDEIAMEPWSQDGTILGKRTEACESPKEMVLDEPTEDVKMVYEETESQNITDSSKTKSLEGKESENATDTSKTKSEEPIKPAIEDDVPKPLPKTPRRVSFITLSSPKSKKKL